MKEFKFYINNIEINEPKNWEDVRFSVVRDKIYFGLLRSSAIESVEIYGDDIEIIKEEFNANGFNSVATFWIERLDSDCLAYKMYAQNIVLFDEIEEDFTLGGGDVMKLKLVDNASLHKMTSREDIDVVVGNSETIQGESTSMLSRQYENVLYKSRGILNEAYYKITDDVDTLKNMSFYKAFPFQTESEYLITSEIYRDVSNTIYSSDYVLHNVHQADPNSSGITAYFDEFNEDHIILEESKFTMDGRMKYFIKFKAMLIHQNTVLADANEVRFRFCIDEYDFDGVLLTNRHQIYYTANIVLGYGGEYDGTYYYKSQDIILQGDYYFEKKKDKVYIPYIEVTEVSGNSPNLYFMNMYWTDEAYPFDTELPTSIAPYTGIFDLSFHSEEIEIDTYHKTHLIYETILSNLEQITDTPNILYSETFGRTDLGYSQNGLFHNYGLTSGYFLRNAVNSDLSEVEMKVNFKDLFQTLTSLFGLALWWENDKIRIETRDIAFQNPGIIEITLDEITKTFNKEYIFTKVEVGNSNIKYENVNGTNEFNNLHEYALPLNVKNKNLQLKTKYNTDYLGVELARRVQFSTDANVDTKYDEKNFLVELKYENSEWVTKLGEDYNVVENIPIPSRAGNLSLSPKRMLMRNSDLIYPSFFMNNGLELKFQSCSNLAVLESKELVSDFLIVERDNLSVFKKLFKPVIWKGIAPQFEISKIINNKEKLFMAKVNCQYIYGWLKTVEEKDGEIEIELMEKY